MTTQTLSSRATQPWRGVVAGLLVAAVTVVAGVVMTDHVGLPLRDPDHVAALYLGLVGLLSLIHI